jgi:hypothetical protein
VSGMAISLNSATSLQIFKTASITCLCETCCYGFSPEPEFIPGEKTNSRERPRRIIIFRATNLSESTVDLISGVQEKSTGLSSGLPRTNYPN